MGETRGGLLGWGECQAETPAFPLPPPRDVPGYLQLQEPVNPMGEKAPLCPVTPQVPGAAGTSRDFGATPAVGKIDIHYFKRFSLLFTEIVTWSRVKICCSLLCFPLGNTL